MPRSITTTRRLMTVGMLSVVTTAPCYAQEAGGKLREIIEEMSKDRCSDVMSTMVKYTCEESKARMQSTFKALGRLDSVSFKGKDATQMGPVEVYVATHQAGKMLWAVQVAPDGKISYLWSPGRIQ